MKYRNIRLHWSLLLLPLGAAALAAGCLSVPTSPDIHVQSFTPGASAGGASSTQGLAGLATGAVPDSIVWIQPLAPQPTGSQTFHLVAARGGDFTFGRAHLHVPPGAVAGDADITITIPDSTTVGCDLSISPASLNHFSKPVTLTFDCDGTTLSQLLSRLRQTLLKPNLRRGLQGELGQLGLGVYWLGPNGWVLVGGTLDLKTLLLSTDLQHFSKYRAGW